MLQTVYARAKESSVRGAIHDAKAEELIKKLDYDFSLADKDTAMRSGVIARTIVLDKLTKSWLATHSGAVVVNIAMSAMDEWGGEISEQNAPVLIVIEGLTMYLNAKDVQLIFAVISNRFSQATIFVETMNPAMVRRFKEKSIDASNAKFNWGIKNGKVLAELLPGFRFMEEHSLTEGMAEFVPIYKLLGKLPAVRDISNKIIVLEKE